MYMCIYIYIYIHMYICIYVYVCGCIQSAFCRYPATIGRGMGEGTARLRRGGTGAASGRNWGLDANI